MVRWWERVWIYWVQREDIFVHFTTIREDGHKSLVQGEYVNFEIVNTIKGKRAKNVISDKDEAS